jgi:hypothetical protein
MSKKTVAVSGKPGVFVATSSTSIFVRNTPKK